ncbi:hypothetical protein AAFF_G00092750 [Aldrovandia affinis]|uniref:Uncharacterized protein n=1 Tax=Aldrovandia affinis TaxID=143900 RepID=A0AAD7WYW3_9TELE|nr:hypothetical protein AAFF_G00092750 [Aldrovandia affinis]
MQATRRGQCVEERFCASHLRASSEAPLRFIADTYGAGTLVNEMCPRSRGRVGTCTKLPDQDLALCRTAPKPPGHTTAGLTHSS